MVLPIHRNLMESFLQYDGLSKQIRADVALRNKGRGGPSQCWGRYVVHDEDQSELHHSTGMMPLLNVKEVPFGRQSHEKQFSTFKTGNDYVVAQSE